MKRTVEFLDEQRNKVTAECEVKNGRFSMSGEYCGSLGQVFDEVKPANDSQQELIDIWRKWHLNGMFTSEKSRVLPEDFEDNLESVLDSIEEIEEENSDRPVEETDIDLFEDFDEPETALALALMLELSISDIEDIQEDGDNRWCVQGVDYLCGTDDEMDVLWDEDLDNYLEECVYPELPDNMRNYFDDDAWKRDAKMDGRAHSLNRYDGDELSESINGTWFYAYRQ